MGWTIRWSSGEISVPSRPAPKPTQPSVQTPGISRGWSDRSVVLNTHPFLVPSCETIGDTFSPPICTCTDTSWGDFYLYVLNKIGCLALRKAPNSHQAKQPVSYMRRHQGCNSPNSNENFKKYIKNIVTIYIHVIYVL